MMRKQSKKRTKHLRPLPHPGAAEPRYFWNKFVDACMVTAMCAGSLTILIFLSVL